MKFERTDIFKADYKRLPVEHQQMFASVVPSFNEACEAYRDNPGYIWPARLRVHRMASVKGVWELTWHFGSPDGRATFEFVTRDNELRVLWRRIGNHSIYTKP